MSPPRKAHVDDGPTAICSSLDRNRTSPYSIVDVAQAEAAHVHRLPKAHRPGRPAPGCGSATWAAASRAPSRARSGAGRLPCARHTTGEAKPDVSARRHAGARVAQLARRGERARELPCRALLATGRSRAPDRRGAREAGARLWDEEHRRAPRTRGEPHEWEEWRGAGRPLPPPQPAHATRGPKGARVRAAQRSPTSREAAPRLARSGSARPRELRALVRRLAAGGRPAHSGSKPAARGRAAPLLAAARRLETSRLDRSRGAARRAVARRRIEGFPS